MRSRTLLSMLCFGAGGFAAALSAAWLVAGWNNAPGYLPEFPQDLSDFAALDSYRAFAGLFVLLQPLLIGVAVLTGLAAWREPAARIGLVFAAAALASRLYFMQAAFGGP